MFKISLPKVNKTPPPSESEGKTISVWKSYRQYATFTTEGEKHRLRVIIIGQIFSTLRLILLLIFLFLLYNKNLVGFKFSQFIHLLAALHS